MDSAPCVDPMQNSRGSVGAVGVNDVCPAYLAIHPDDTSVVGLGATRRGGDTRLHSETERDAEDYCFTKGKSLQVVGMLQGRTSHRVKTRKLRHRYPDICQTTITIKGFVLQSRLPNLTLVPDPRRSFMPRNNEEVNAAVGRIVVFDCAEGTYSLYRPEKDLAHRLIVVGTLEGARQAGEFHVGKSFSPTAQEMQIYIGSTRAIQAPRAFEIQLPLGQLAIRLLHKEIRNRVPTARIIVPLRFSTLVKKHFVAFFSDITLQPKATDGFLTQFNRFLRMVAYASQCGMDVNYTLFFSIWTMLLLFARVLPPKDFWAVLFSQPFSIHQIFYVATGDPADGCALNQHDVRVQTMLSVLDAKAHGVTVPVGGSSLQRIAYSLVLFVEAAFNNKDRDMVAVLNNISLLRSCAWDAIETARKLFIESQDLQCLGLQWDDKKFASGNIATEIQLSVAEYENLHRALGVAQVWIANEGKTPAFIALTSKEMAEKLEPVFKALEMVQKRVLRMECAAYSYFKDSRDTRCFILEIMELPSVAGRMRSRQYFHMEALHLNNGHGVTRKELVTMCQDDTTMPTFAKNVLDVVSVDNFTADNLISAAFLTDKT